MTLEENIRQQAEAILAPRKQAAAAHLAAAVSAAAPKGKTGRMGSSISAVVSGNTIKVMSSDFASVFIEFGFRHRIGKKSLIGKGKKKRLGYTRLSKEQIAAGEFKEIDPNPFMRKTIFRELPAVVAILSGAH